MSSVLSEQQVSTTAAQTGPKTVKAWAAQTATDPLAPFSIGRRDPLPSDVVIEVLYCGVCHSDLHQARNEWKNSIYPVVPGHEIVGRVQKIGNSVTKFKAGDLAAVGCMVDSCRTCASCRRGLEQYCEQFPTFTYNGLDKHSPGGQNPTFGGYSESIVVDEAFTLRVAPNANPAATAPLLCAGITTYSPLRHWNVGPGQEGRHRRTRRSRSHGREVCPGVRGACGVIHNVTIEGRGCKAAWSPRSRDLEECRRDEKAFQQLRLHSRCSIRESRHQRVPHSIEAGRHADSGWGAGGSAERSYRSI